MTKNYVLMLIVVCTIASTQAVVLKTTVIKSVPAGHYVFIYQDAHTTFKDYAFTQVADALKAFTQDNYPHLLMVEIPAWYKQFVNQHPSSKHEFITQLAAQLPLGNYTCFADVSRTTELTCHMLQYILKGSLAEGTDKQFEQWLIGVYKIITFDQFFDEITQYCTSMQEIIAQLYNTLPPTLYMQPLSGWSKLLQKIAYFTIQAKKEVGAYNRVDSSCYTVLQNWFTSYYDKHNKPDASAVVQLLKVLQEIKQLEAEHIFNIHMVSLFDAYIVYTILLNAKLNPSSRTIVCAGLIHGERIQRVLEQCGYVTLIDTPLGRHASIIDYAALIRGKVPKEGTSAELLAQYLEEDAAPTQLYDFMASSLSQQQLEKIVPTIPSCGKKSTGWYGTLLDTIKRLF